MERINVAVRARPLSSEDAKSSPWRISGNSILFANPTTKFEFDRIFSEDCRTVDVYESRTKAIVSAAIGGFNGTVFAYGQTNSGKTHTMRGSSVEPGVIPLAVHDLFDKIQQETDREFLLRMSYMEIYNEEINDLLAPEHRRLQIHESIERGIFVAGLKEEIVTSPKQVLEFMDFGEAHRHIGETNMNLHSSRSHTIFRMIIESRDKVEDELSESSCDAVRVSVLNLVDLAGSERAAKTGAEGVRLKEGSHINKSLMTLGTVIKKLSEGAESQGGHVPYRDSKLTRILQPALGGNANTAIICNITLAQIHADETKSSLQFASRALRVTNCVHVNEILTDAALLKRQKKEIEELRAKLQGSHSEHLGDEILNLRNTLLQSELERERIALELEEEKKAQAERDKMLQVQAKKIQNLSSMVISSSRDEVPYYHKKEKRRDTWCPGKLPKKMMNELPSTIPTQASAMKPVVRSERERGPLLPFEELVNDNTSNACNQERDRKSVSFCDFGLPDQRSLMHVTSRKKASNRKKSLPMESVELTEVKAEYEKLLMEFEAERTTNEIQIDYLTRRLADALDNEHKIKYTSDTDKSSMEIEAILVIKQLQEKISVLEMEKEKASSLENLDPVVDLETEKDKDAIDKYEKLYKELLVAQEEAHLAHQQLTSSMDEDSEALAKLSTNIQEITFEIQQSKALFESEHFQNHSALSDLIAEVRSFSSHDFAQIKRLLGDYEKVHSCMKAKVDELECEKISVLEMEKASSLQNLDSVVELEKQKDKYEELYMELLAAKEDANYAHQQLTSLMDEDSEALAKISTNIQEITFEIQHSKPLVESISISITSMMDEHLQSCSALSDLISDIGSFSSHDITQIKRLLGDYEKLHSCMKLKIAELEHEKMENLDSDKYASNKHEEVYMELLASQEDTKLAHQQLTLSMDEDSEALTKLSTNIEEITFDIQQSKTLVDSITSMMDEHLQSCNTLIDDVRSFSSHDFTQMKTLLCDYEKLHSCMKAKVEELEHEKLLMCNQSEDLQKRLEEACLSGENSSQALTELSERYETETNELITEIRTLENEIGHLSTSVLAKEKESMRKDLEKTKAKLKETESKLRNTIQEKTKLEGEKASAEREIKRLHSQKMILERDMNKRESRRDSVLDRSSNIFEPRKGKGLVNHVDQEEYRKLEVLAFDMERTIVSLEEQLATANDESQQAVIRSESLVQEVEELSDKLEYSNSELERFEEMVSSLRANLEEAAIKNQNADSSISMLMEEKEEMAMQLTDALLAIEEERAIWSTTQKASIEAIESKSKSYNAEIALLTDKMSEVRNELEACRETYNIINEKLAVSEEKVEVEKSCSMEKSLEIDRLKNDLILLDDQKKTSEDKLLNQIVEITKERKELVAQIEEQQLLMETCNDKLLNAKAKVEELTMKLSTLEAKTHSGNIEKAKLRMRLNGAQTRLDGMRVRCKEEMEEKEFMNKKFEEATNKLKEQLVCCRTENMNLKKHLLLKE
ncbi:kinesin-like protein KIN-7O isoform X1 [Lactuca sativa]|uniref:kinesin-like protein KIN-7O isoform X1 n=1 Tax=Lactuca sativa TaxID=4236 RepID=UPI0022AEB279|nr:kinesin-like protein KIN-7O isoform X1 [Lactuca sativa]